MKNKNLIAPRFDIAFNEAGDLPKEIQVLKKGKFSHPFFGQFSIDDKMFDAMVKNFDDRAVGTDINVDFDHQFGKAAAWITGLKKKGEGLFAEIDWTPAGAESVKNREYRYTSAEFNENFASNEDGKKFGPTLLAVALTNRPFVKGMDPTVQLSEITEDQSMEELKKLNDRITDLESKNKTLADERDAAIEEKTEVAKKLSEAEKKVEELEAEKVETDKKAKFDEMLRNGKVVEAQRESYMTGDLAKFAELSGKANTKPEGSDHTPDEPTGDVEEKVIGLAEKKIEAGEAKDLGEAISKVLSEKPELEKAYRG